MTFADIVLILHVLGAGLLVGVVFFSCVLALKSPLTPEKVTLIDRLAPFGKLGAGWQFVTGLYLAWQHWSDVRSLTIFWIKIGLFLAAGLIIEFLIRQQAHRALNQTDQGGAKNLAFGAVLLAIVIIVIVSIGVILVEHH